VPRRKKSSAENIIALARKHKAIHPDLSRFSKRKRLTAKEKGTVKRILKRYATLAEKYGAGGFTLLRGEKEIKNATRSGLRIGKFNLVRLNNYANDDAPLEIRHGAKLVIQRARHKYNSHIRKWHFHRVDARFKASKAAIDPDIKEQILDAYRDELGRANELIHRTKAKTVTLYLWGNKGIMYRVSAFTTDDLLLNLRDYLEGKNSSGLPVFAKKLGKNTFVDEFLMGFAWHTNKNTITSKSVERYKRKKRIAARKANAKRKKRR
jgi:hypothetical protein